jgi:ribose transport system permease protein
LTNMRYGPGHGEIEGSGHRRLGVLRAGAIDVLEGGAAVPRLIPRRAAPAAAGAPAAPSAVTAGPAVTLSARSISALLWLLRLGPFLILVLLVIAMSIASPVFFTERNLQNLSVQSASICILALGMLLVILTRGIDLSVGSVLSLCSVVGASVYDGRFSSGLWVIAAMCVTGTVIGAVNGTIYVKGRIPSPFIVTLAMLSVASGLAFMISNGQPNIGMPPAVNWLGSAYIGAVPVAPLLVAVVAGLVWALTRRMTWGRWIYAIGGNPEAAERVGIPVNRVLISVYMFAGLSAGIAAVIVSGRTDSGFPSAGTLAELDAIAAVIIGGAAFTGGRGGVSNAIIGALTLGVIRNGLNLLGVDPFLQIVIIGLTIVVAVQLDVIRSGVEGRFRALVSDTGGTR